MKKGIIVGTALVGIAGGFLIAQNTLFGSAEAQISASEAKKIALEAYDGKVIEFEFDRDDKTPHYEFDIKNGNEKVELVVDAATGSVTILDIEKEKTTALEKAEDTADAVKSDAKIALNDATNKVNSEVAKGTETVKEQTVQTTQPTQAAKQEQPAQAQSQATKQQQPAQEAKPTAQKAGQISKSQAVNIAYTVASGTVVKVELDSDDGRLKYEIELRDGNTEYNVDIDAHTGKILDVDRDVEDDDRDDYDDFNDDNNDD